jgi:competence protein ComEC
MRRLWRLLLILATVATACTPASAPPPTPSPTAQPKIEVVFLDVGESGDGFLVKTWEEKYMLIDGGRRDSGVTEALQARGVPRIDVLVATNPDADHIGGLISVLKALPVGEVWLSGDTNTTRTFEDFVEAVSASRASVHRARRGDVIRLGSLTAQVLNPSEPLFSDRNNNSVALRLEFGRVSFLFTGDMEKEAEARLLAAGVSLKSTILKLGHHGSRTSTSPAFLATVQPEVAVYQAGANNRYGHPHRETLEALARANVQVYGTGANGVIVLTSDGTSYKVETRR